MLMSEFNRLESIDSSRMSPMASRVLIVRAKVVGVKHVNASQALNKVPHITAHAAAHAAAILHIDRSACGDF